MPKKRASYIGRMRTSARNYKCPTNLSYVSRLKTPQIGTMKGVNAAPDLVVFFFVFILGCSNRLPAKRLHSSAT